MREEERAEAPHNGKTTSHFLSPRRAWGRLTIACVVGFMAAFACPPSVGWQLRGVVGWDAGAFALLLLAWSFIARATPEQTKLRAATEDPGRTMVWVLALASSLFSLFSAMFVLRRVRTMGIEGSICWGTLAVLAIVLAWTLTHTSYALRYAHLYYRGKRQGGIEFPGECAPADMDFAYLSFTIGMCFQTSDVAISNRRIRRTALGHALLSFVYNTLVVGLVLNLLFGFLN